MYQYFAYNIHHSQVHILLEYESVFYIYNKGTADLMHCTGGLDKLCNISKVNRQITVAFSNINQCLLNSPAIKWSHKTDLKEKQMQNPFDNGMTTM